MSAAVNESHSIAGAGHEDKPGPHVAISADGTRICIDDIATVAEGRRILDELDAGILDTEDQLREAAAGRRQSTRTWRRSAELALKWKRLMRPRLQERIGELKRADKTSASVEAARAYAAAIDGRRGAFIAAATELLDREVCTEIWARAAELKPEAFSDGAAGGPA